MRMILMLSMISLTGGVTGASHVDFATEVLPVLRRSCFECHGPDERKGGLRLDERGPAISGGEHGAVIVPGDPESSELLRRVTLPRTDKEAMPRRGARLTEAETAVLRSWIVGGAHWPDEVRERAH
jgi:mono/diheme cytochrome c family protein